MSIQEGLSNLALSASLFLTYTAKEYEVITPSLYNSLMFATITIGSIIFWRTIRAKE
ncbi:hypothetical protein AU106_gp093 [Sinorhizobium phage phiM9]|uniref:Uncharacterized protein n=1 Tax=Sinorhizobium phage phiM9 TaxID=1636182 RepID=A0A0F6TGM4_9CAUD|nr:hypothetical protein AU106_gp093 [Sinorhizobium phage phiM9]AKE44724.1 hypothetical protein Sm_phiM9_096 [Sinorhizobium phage phiM9]